MKLIALPAFTDNYIWMLHDGQRALVVDPGEPAPVVAALQSHQLALEAILVTHHHADHVGGVQALRPLLQGSVYGPAREDIPGPFVALHDGDHVRVLDLDFAILDVPGHTSGHIAYFQAGPADGSDAPILFCGDTLFSGGCGRLFEGTAAQMLRSLARLAELPGDTRVCCAHEYTLANLRFARAVDPDNAELAAYTQACESLRERGLPTLPSSIARERQVNPFLRSAQVALVRSARAHGAPSDDPLAVWATLREWKNSFR